ncbi:hypothetical protein MBLNU230_g7562t1 [Neophaeotheca triangularis]
MSLPKSDGNGVDSFLVGGSSTAEAINSNGKRNALHEHEDSNSPKKDCLHTITYREREKLQLQTYGEDEKAGWEKVRKAFAKRVLVPDNPSESDTLDPQYKPHDLSVHCRAWRSDLMEELESYEGERPSGIPDSIINKLSKPGLSRYPGASGSGGADYVPPTVYAGSDVVKKIEEFGSRGVDIVNTLREPYWLYDPVAGRLSEEKIAEIKDALRPAPHHLYRASSWEGRGRTNGYDTMEYHIPAAHLAETTKCHDTLYEIPNSNNHLREMLGLRLLWEHRKADQTLSWTSSPLFAFVHGTGRLAKGQRHVSIHLLDTRKARTLKGQAVEFHEAPNLMRILDIQGWTGWSYEYQVKKLRAPWYTHELLSHHVVHSPPGGSYEADVEELLEVGLYDLIPSLNMANADGEEENMSLYHRCCRARSLGKRIESKPVPFTRETVQLANKLALCFRKQGALKPSEDAVAPLHILIDLLSMVERPAADSVFTEWIKLHYTAVDIIDCGYERRSRVANNLPEIMQALDLARTASAALGGPAIPPTTVWMADPDYDWYGRWQQSVPKKIKMWKRYTPRKRKSLAAQLPASTPLEGSGSDGDSAVGDVESGEEEATAEEADNEEATSEVAGGKTVGEEAEGEEAARDISQASDAEQSG